MTFSPSPRARGLTTLLALLGTLFARDVGAMALLWGAVLLPLMLAAGLVRQHLRFILVILAPVAVASGIVWGLVVGAPPGAPAGSAPALGLQYAAMITLRLAILGGIVQAGLLSVPGDDLSDTLRAWRIRGDALVVALGCFALAPELRLRAGQVITARYARGLVRSRGPIARLRQLPHMLLPLLAWTLRSAVQRADSWRERGLLSLVDRPDGEAHSGWQLADAAYVLAGIVWVSYNLVSTASRR